MAVSISDHSSNSLALCELSRALALSGDYQRAEMIASPPSHLPAPQPGTPTACPPPGWPPFPPPRGQAAPW